MMAFTVRSIPVVLTDAAYAWVLIAVTCAADNARGQTSPNRCASLASVKSAIIDLTSAAPYFLHDSSACTRSQTEEQHWAAALTGPDAKQLFIRSELLHSSTSVWRRTVVNRTV